MENQNSVCYVARINEIKPIKGADKIELAIVGGWNCVIQKGQYAEGGLVIVATTDAVIPQELSDALNVTNYLRKGQRVKTVKLKGVYSECLIIPFNMTVGRTKDIKTWKKGDDLMEALGIFKYEPPVKTISLGSGRKIKYKDNPNFGIYYKFPNVKNVPNMFNENDVVEITRKIHGTNARYGIVKKSNLSIWDRVKRFFGDKWVDYEYVYGSHNVEKGSDSQGFYSTDVWRTTAEQYGIKEKLWNYVRQNESPESIGGGLIIYGEIYGAGIQKNYEYGLKNTEFVGFDVSVDGKYKDVEYTQTFFNNSINWGNTFNYVEVLYTGKWSKEVQDKFVFNNFIEGTKVPHEGIVIKDVLGDRRKIAKVINPDYLIFGEKHDIGDSH